MAITGAAFGTGTTPSTSISAPALPGVALGDLLLIWITNATSTVTYTVSAGSTGWTAVGPTTGQNITATLFYKNADSNDVSLSSGSGSYTITASASHSAEGLLIDAPGFAFDPIPSVAGQFAATSAGASFPATGITVGYPADILMVLGTTRSASGAPSAMTLPGGFSTLVAQGNSTSGAAANVGVIAGTKTQPASGATGNQTVTSAGNTNGGAFLFALTVASLPIPAPTRRFPAWPRRGVPRPGGLTPPASQPAASPAPIVRGPRRVPWRAQRKLSVSKPPGPTIPVTPAASAPQQAARRRLPWQAQRKLSIQTPPGQQYIVRSAQCVTTGSGSLTLNVTAQPCAVGDLIVIWAASGFAAMTWTSAGGDNLTSETANSPATTPQMSSQLFHKIATSADVAKYQSSGSYTITISVSHCWSALIAVVPVTDQVHPFDPSDTPGSGQSNVASNSADAAGITTAGAPRLNLWLGATRNTAGAAPPTMTAPPGYAIPVGTTQANSSGAATANTGVVIAQSTDENIGATGTVSGAFTGPQISAGLLLSIKASPVTPLPGSVAQMVAGAPTASTVGVVGKTIAATSCRLAYSTSPSMTSPSYIAAQIPDSMGYVRYTVPALTSRTRYYFQLADTPSGGQETLIGIIGSCKTLPVSGSPQNFTVALVSCVAEQDTSTPPALDVAMADWNTYNADLNLFTGDFDYTGTTSTVLSTQVGIYETQIVLYANYALMVQNHWGFYCRSDHEAGPDNGDSNNSYTATNIAAAQEVFPFGTLGDTTNNPVHGLYQAWVVGRVRFIMIDIRNTDRSPGGNTDNGSKTMLGALQLAWLENQLIQSEPLKVIVGDVAWMGPASISNGPDKWWSYATERSAIIAYMAANAAQVQNVMYWHGDSHLVGCTPAVNNPYGNFPVYCAAPLLNVGGGLNTGTFTQFYNNAGGECRFYGRIAITDDGNKITVNFQGWDAANAIAQVQQTDVFQTTPSIPVMPLRKPALAPIMRRRPQSVLKTVVVVPPPAVPASIRKQAARNVRRPRTQVLAFRKLHAVRVSLVKRPLGWMARRLGIGQMAQTQGSVPPPVTNVPGTVSVSNSSASVQTSNASGSVEVSNE